MPAAEHAASLPAYEGFVIHHGPERSREGAWYVFHSRSAYIDGTLDPQDPPELRAHSVGECLSLDAAEAYGRAIIAAVEEARAS